MTKTQYEAVVKHIKDNTGVNFKLRCNLSSGGWVQGKPELIGTNVLILMQDNKQYAYVDLGSVEYITAG